jgi:26S proteasome regulatory subunit N3
MFLLYRVSCKHPLINAHPQAIRLCLLLLLLHVCSAPLQAREVADAAVGLLQQHNRRTLDSIGARIYFYYSWAYECTGALADVRR